MSVHTLPLPTNLPHFEFSVDLDDEVFVLEMRWNERDSSWYLTIKDSLDTILIAGRKVLVNLPLTSRFRRLGMPKGELIAIDTTGEDLDPGESDLGSRVQLVYFDAASLPAEFVV